MKASYIIIRCSSSIHLQVRIKMQMSMPVDLQLPHQVVGERVAAVVDLEHFNIVGVRGKFEMKKMLSLSIISLLLTRSIIRSNVRDDP